MTHLRRSPTRLGAAPLAVAFAVLVTACGDPPPPVVDASTIEGAPIAGVAFDAPAGSGPEAPRAPGPDAPPAPAGDTATAQAPDMPAIGDPSTPDERLPADEPVLIQPPAVPPSATAPTAPTEPAAAPVVDAPNVDAPNNDAPSEIPATTASQADKPALPDKPATEPAAPTAPDAAAAAPGGAKSLIPKDQKAGEPILLTFDQLASFDFTPPPLPPVEEADTPPPDPEIALEAIRKQIPPEIWELEGRVISVEGYMIPLEYADEGVKAFLISRHAMGCCFGIMPRAHELIECDMGEGKSTPYVGYLPVIVTGVFHVGPTGGPQSFMTGIYRMDAPKVTIPKEQ